MGSRMRRLQAPAAVAFTRLRRRAGRAALASLGIGLAAAMVVAVLIASALVQDRAVRHSLSPLPPSQRSFRIDTSSISGSDYADSNRVASGALRLLAKEPPVRAVEIRDARIGVRLVRVIGIDELRRWVRVRSGRLPRSCTLQRCEVLSVGTTSARIAGLHLVVVGSGSIIQANPFGNEVSKTPTGPDVVVANGVSNVSSLPQFDLIQRGYSWIVPIRPSVVHSWQIGTLLARESRAQAKLDQAGGLLTLSTPDQALEDARNAGRIAATRMLLVGGQAVALLLVFALVVSGGYRRTLAAERTRFEQRGARVLQIGVLVATELGTLTLLAWIAGTIAASVIGVLVSGESFTLLAHSVLTTRGLLVLAIAWLAATLLVAGPAWRDRGSQFSSRALDVAALGCIVAAIVGISRGTANATALSSGGGAGVILFLLPGLLSFAVAVLALRAVGPLLRLLERATRERNVLFQLATIGLVRTPQRTALAVSFLVVSLGLAVFAGSYHATLTRGIDDAAGFRVPLDFTASEGTQLRAPLDVAPLVRYDNLAPGVTAYPVVRRTADVPGEGTSRITLDALGIPSASLPRLRGWRGDYAAKSKNALAAALGPADDPSLRGPRLPRGTRALHAHLVTQGVPVDLDFVLETTARHFVRLPVRFKTRTSAFVRVPASAGGARLVALEISPTLGAFQSFEHRAAEGEAIGTLAGTFRPGTLYIVGKHRVSNAVHWKRWLPRDGAEVSTRTPLVIRYDFTNSQIVLFRPRQTTDDVPVPVIVSPDVARTAPPGNLLALDFQDETVLGRVVAVARRFPTTQDAGGSFAVADESRLATALDADAPGSGTPLELWLRVPASQTLRVAAALRKQPFDALDVSSRRGIQQGLAASPIAHGTLFMLVLAAVVGGVLAVTGIWLSVMADLRDESSELYDLEVEGATPAALRNVVRIQVVTVVFFGIVGGVGFGAALSTLAVRIVQVTANAGTAIPPLVHVVGWASVLVALAVLIVAAAALVEATTAAAFRGNVARRPVGP